MKKLTILIALIMLAGCQDQLDLTNPNEPTTTTYWKTQSDAVRASTAMYNALINDGTYMRMIPALTDGRSDGFKADTPWPDLWQVAAFNVPATSGPVEWEWQAHYILISRANQVLAYVPDIDMDENLKQRILGQAYFLRGLAYFNLANNFYRVPVVTTVQTADEYNTPTATQEELWQQIFDDFKKAQTMLPISYADVTGPDNGQIGRATAGAATGMLGKAYLYRERWQDASTEFEKLVDGGPMAVYKLMDNFRDNFDVAHENNSESLFEVQFATPDQVGGSTMNYGGDPNSNWMQVSSQAYTYAAEGYGYSDFLPSRWLYNEFKKEQTVDGHLDPRLLATIVSYEPSENSTTVYGDPWPYESQDVIFPRKYTNEGLPQPELREQSGINYRILRFSDILLMYAEAQNELDHRGVAAQYIQRVRDRANLPDRVAEFTGYTKQEMRDQIAHERALEFAIEAQRIHDMIRWGWFDEGSPQFKVPELRTRDSEFDSWAPGDEYLPIPQRELDVNPNLEPNPANN